MTALTMSTSKKGVMPPASLACRPFLLHPHGLRRGLEECRPRCGLRVKVLFAFLPYRTLSGGSEGALALGVGEQAGLEGAGGELFMLNRAQHLGYGLFQ